MLCWILFAFLLGTIMSGGPLPRRNRSETTRRNMPTARAYNRAPVLPQPRVNTPPPSYSDLSPRHADGTVDLETVRARHPPERPLNPAIPNDSPIEAAYLAAATAFIGYAAAVEDETHPCMIAARVAQAILIAASNARTHAALLAAVNTIELIALLDFQGLPDRTDETDEEAGKILNDCIDTAVQRALDQAPPSDTFVPHHAFQSAGHVPANMTLAKRAFMEAFILNVHITRPSQ